MAATASPSKNDFKMPMPPPLVHTRAAHDRPSTPTQAGFVSPTATPVGSPSKKQLPPGAHDLPDVFENAMRLAPTAGNPNKATLDSFKGHSSSPSKDRVPLTADKSNDFRASVIQSKPQLAPGSPTKLGKENTPPAQAQYGSAAAARGEIYKTREQSPVRPVQRGLAPDVLEKLQKPSVKRLANVTQLCKKKIPYQKIASTIDIGRLS